MDWNFQSVKYLHELVQQYGGRKSGGREAEFQERIRSMPASWRECLGFGLSARQVFKGGRLDSENSKLVKVSTVPKVTSRNPGHAAGAYWHRSCGVWHNIAESGHGRLKK